jgi:two-component sensor histidine kinase/PAS domain-containing protein
LILIRSLTARLVRYVAPLPDWPERYEARGPYFADEEYVDTAVLEREIAREQSILDAIPILADLLRSDVLCLDGGSADQLRVTAHAQPHSSASLYSENLKDQTVKPEKNSPLARSFPGRARTRGCLTLADGVVVHQDVWPLSNSGGLTYGVLCIETAQREHESYQQRGHSLQNAFGILTEMVVRGDLRAAARLGPFYARDAIIVVGRDMKVRYASNVAEGMYGKLGITRRLTNERIDTLETGDEDLVWQALQERQCFQREEPVRDSIWVRGVIPLVRSRPRPPLQRGWPLLTDLLPEPTSVLLLISDVTQERQRQEDQVRLETVSKEIHHRVKNNLQTIISLTRFEARRAQSAETKLALEELNNRIFAVAQVHEYLSSADSESIQLKEVSRKIAKQVRDSLLPKDSRISIEVEGDAVSLAPRQATACALIVNELVQNAVEHAFEGADGLIRIQLEDTPEGVRIAVVDNGRGLPPGFEWRHSQSLGLKIVHTLVQDLRGELRLKNLDSPAHGLVAQITLSKMLSGGK